MENQMAVISEADQKKMRYIIDLLRSVMYSSAEEGNENMLQEAEQLAKLLGEFDGVPYERENNRLIMAFAMHEPTMWKRIEHWNDWARQHVILALVNECWESFLYEQENDEDSPAFDKAYGRLEALVGKEKANELWSIEQKEMISCPCKECENGCGDGDGDGTDDPSILQLMFEVDAERKRADEAEAALVEANQKLDELRKIIASYQMS